MVGAAREQSVEIRALRPDDDAAFEDFVSQVRTGEQRFLKEDLSDPAASFATMLDDTSARRVVAVGATGEIVGLAGAFPGQGWSSHVAEVRVLVSSMHRGRGVGRELARAVLVEALELGCGHVYVELVAEQEALVAMFQDLGFAPEALLADFVRDGDGNFHDLMLLTHRVEDNHGRHHALGLDEVTA
jgi:L-amino acid N-acyltransferase YncA